MCGVCGFATSELVVSQENLDNMIDTMIHRGPDDRGIAYFGTTGLGFRRLSILDVNGGHQPMRSEDGSIVTVVNGEIYNFRELRQELLQKGHRFHSGSDAEVVPHLYEESGIDGLAQKLRGMFAAAVVDRRNGSLHLIRDHFGIKPLYYALTSKGLLFASEIRSLLRSGLIHPTLNERGLWHYLTFQYVPDPETMFAEIHKLPPAHYLSYIRGHASLTRYWQLSYSPDSAWTLPALTEAIHSQLKDSVKRHMMSDVPRGAYLSSGIDSSAIVAFLRQHQQLNTFSIGFSGDHGEVNELEHARQTARLLDTIHHEVIISPEEYLDALPDIIQFQEEPIADPSAPALYFLAREARRQVAVVLSGEGADELFAGYPIYHEPYALKVFDYLPSPVRKGLGQAAERLPASVKGRGYLMRGAQSLEHRFIGNAKIFSEAEKERLVHPDWSRAREPYWALTAPYYEASRGLDPVSRMQTVDGHTWLPSDILMKADKMSMAHSLELRVPFLDVKVFELAATIPERFKVTAGTTKFALRQALLPELPKEVAERPKLGFPIPIRHWLDHQMRDFAHDLLTPANTPFFQPVAVQALLAGNPKTIVNRDRKLWTLLVFTLWCEKFAGDFGSTHKGHQPVSEEVPLA